MPSSPICRDVFRGDALALQVLDRSSVRTCSHDEPFAIISITDPQNRHRVLPSDRNCTGVLRLAFSDVEARAAALHITSPYWTAFTQETGRQIAEFVCEQIGAGTRLIVAQCDAGMSRSAGVASALSQFYNHDEAFFIVHYRPNRWVRRLTLEALKGVSHE